MLVRQAEIGQVLAAVDVASSLSSAESMLRQQAASVALASVGEPEPSAP
jgi:hypothetical protein